MLGQKEFDINEEKKTWRKWGLKIDISSDIPPQNMSTGPTTHLSSAQETDLKNIIHHFFMTIVIFFSAFEVELFEPTKDEDIAISTKF